MSSSALGIGLLIVSNSRRKHVFSHYVHQDEISKVRPRISFESHSQWILICSLCQVRIFSLHRYHDLRGVLAPRNASCFSVELAHAIEATFVGHGPYADLDTLERSWVQIFCKGESMFSTATCAEYLVLLERQAMGQALDVWGLNSKTYCIAMVR